MDMKKMKARYRTVEQDQADALKRVSALTARMASIEDEVIEEEGCVCKLHDLVCSHTELDLDEHFCIRSQSWDEVDAQGIYLCRVCEVCCDAKLARYRPEILTGYNQEDVDEPIEEAE